MIPKPVGEPLTCATLRHIATANGTLGCSEVILRTADGTRLRIVARQVVAPWEPDEVTGRPRLTGVPTLILTVEADR